MLEILLGVFQLKTTLILLGSTDIPPSKIIWPKKGTRFSQNSHLLSLTYSWCSEFLQNQMEMFRVFIFILGVDQNVIDKHNHELIQVLYEDFVHQVHEIGQSICQSKRMTIYSYSMYLVMNVVLGMSLSRIFS
jgi:hypothetical protein